jgi:hemolysin activation/secretion protein
MLSNRGENTYSLSGAGIGVRIKMADFLDLRADQGWRLDEDGMETHIGLQFTY